MTTKVTLHLSVDVGEWPEAVQHYIAGAFGGAIELAKEQIAQVVAYLPVIYTVGIETVIQDERGVIHEA